VPEHITMFGACAAPVGAVYPFLLAHDGYHGLPCPLLALTGVPCPFCGMTVATVAITHGHWATATAASPLAFLVAALAVGTAPVLVARAAGQVPAPQPWPAGTRRRIGRIVAGLVALSWLFQLRRYGFL
jgi:Protein of unknown function (DUF2752)